MNQKHIKSALEKILSKEDSDPVREKILSRKVSSKHDGKIELLLEHVKLLVAYLRFDAEASRREMFEARKLLEK